MQIETRHWETQKGKKSEFYLCLGPGVFNRGLRSGIYVLSGVQKPLKIRVSAQVSFTFLTYALYLEVLASRCLEPVVQKPYMKTLLGHSLDIIYCSENLQRNH